ncbi:MAG: hypothetical protein R3D26_07875 [Cyanobacteriota/Melainabacteria group bacterium]
MKINDEQVLHGLVKAVCERRDYYAWRVVLLYINSRPYLRKFVLVSILELGNLDTFEALIYFVLTSESRREMGLLLEHLRWLQQFRQDLIWKRSEIRSFEFGELLLQSHQ